MFPSGLPALYVLPGGKRLLAVLGAGTNDRGAVDNAIVDADSLTVLAHFQLKVFGEEVSIPLRSFDASGRFIALSMWHANDVGLYSAKDGTFIRTLRSDQPIWAIALSPDGRTLAVAVAEQFESVEGKVQLFDTQTGAMVSALPSMKDVVGWLDFSPNGHFLAGAVRDGTGRLWNLDTKKEAARLSSSQEVNQIRFSPDGERLISCGRYHSITIWDGHSGAEVMTLKYAPTRAMPSVRGPFDDARFTRDGKSVLSACSDGLVRIWHSVPWK